MWSQMSSDGRDTSVIWSRRAADGGSSCGADYTHRDDRQAGHIYRTRVARRYRRGLRGQGRGAVAASRPCRHRALDQVERPTCGERRPLPAAACSPEARVEGWRTTAKGVHDGKAALRSRGRCRQRRSPRSAARNEDPRAVGGRTAPRRLARLGQRGQCSPRRGGPARHERTVHSSVSAAPASRTST